jgi:hypothetical protein
VASPTRPSKNSCVVCKNVDLADLARVDMIAGDPTRWPRTLWRENGWDPPKGLLPRHYRQWGQFAVSRDWFRRNGYDDLTDDQIRAHLTHVPKMPVAPAELAHTGLIEGEPVTKGIVRPNVDPNAYLAYYAKSVAVGIKGLALLEKRVEMIEQTGEQVPLDLIKMMVEAGSKTATSQAQIRSRGVKMGEDADDDAFRRAASPQPDGETPKFGALRIRTIEGESRPVTDGGLGDRLDYNERAKKEGNPGLLT